MSWEWPCYKANYSGSFAWCLSWCDILCHLEIPPETRRKQVWFFNLEPDHEWKQTSDHRIVYSLWYYAISNQRHSAVQHLGGLWSRPCMRILLAILDSIIIATCHCAVINTMESACHSRGSMWTGENAAVCHLQNQKLVCGKPFRWAVMRMLTRDQAAVQIWLKWNLSHVITYHNFNHDTCYQENTADSNLWAASLQGV